jgi:hypothetical protein
MDTLLHDQTTSNHHNAAPVLPTLSTTPCIITFSRLPGPQLPVPNIEASLAFRGAISGARYDADQYSMFSRLCET